MRKEEQRYRKRLKTLFIIDFLIVAVPIIFFLVVKTSFILILQKKVKCQERMLLVSDTLYRS